MNEQSVGRAALWMAGWVSLFLAMAVAGRTATSELDAFQVMEIRSVLGWFMLLPLVARAGGFSAMKTSRLGLHVGRNTVHYAGQYLWLVALTMIPLAELIAIEFTTPIWTAVVAALFLGERLTTGRIVSILLGTIGVLVIVRPGLQEVQTGHLIILVGAVGFGLSIVMVRALTRTEPVVKIVFWMLIIQSAIGLAPALIYWRTPTWEVMPALLVIAFAGTFSHYCMAQALKLAEATVVSPMDYVRLPLSALIGYLLYAEKIDVFTAIGALLIVAGNLANLARRPAKAAQPPSDVS